MSALRLMPDDPFTQVPNRLLDRMAEFSRAEFLVIMCVARYTVGFHRGEVEMGIRLFSRRTGLNKDSISSAVSSLSARGEIGVGRGHRGRGIYSIRTVPTANDCPEGRDGQDVHDCAGKQDSHCPEIRATEAGLTVRKSRTGERNHHQKEKKKERADIPSSVDDEGKKKLQRERLADPKAEFRARLTERHGADPDFDAALATDLVAIALGDLNLSLTEEFLDFEARTTMNPAGLYNPVGYYRRLPKKFANQRAKEALEQQMAVNRAIEIKPTPPCDCRGSGLINFEPGNYCVCSMGSDLRRAEGRIAMEKAQER